MDPDFFQGWLEEAQADVEKVLRDAGAQGQEIREMGARSLDLGAQILSERLMGRDTAIAESALKSIHLDIAAATTTVVANSVGTVIETNLIRAAKLLGTILVTV